MIPHTYILTKLIKLTVPYNIVLRLTQNVLHYIIQDQ